MRRRTPPGIAFACAAKAAQDEIARRLYHLSHEDAEAIGFHFSHCCAMPLPDRVRYLAARIAERVGLMDPEAQR